MSILTTRQKQTRTTQPSPPTKQQVRMAQARAGTRRTIAEFKAMADKPPDKFTRVGRGKYPQVKPLIEELKKPLENQAELQAIYQAEQKQPLWQKLLFGPTVIKTPKGTYQQILTTYPPPIGGFPVRVATIPINVNKLLASAKVRELLKLPVRDPSYPAQEAGAATKAWQAWRAAEAAKREAHYLKYKPPSAPSVPPRIYPKLLTSSQLLILGKALNETNQTQALRKLWTAADREGITEKQFVDAVATETITSQQVRQRLALEGVKQTQAAFKTAISQKRGEMARAGIRETTEQFTGTRPKVETGTGRVVRPAIRTKMPPKTKTKAPPRVPPRITKTPPRITEPPPKVPPITRLPPPIRGKKPPVKVEKVVGKPVINPASVLWRQGRVTIGVEPPYRIGTTDVIYRPSPRGSRGTPQQTLRTRRGKNPPQEIHLGMGVTRAVVKRGKKILFFRQRIKL